MPKHFHQLASSNSDNKPFFISKRVKSFRVLIYIGCFTSIIIISLWYLTSFASRTTRKMDNKKNSSLSLIHINSWKNSKDDGAIQFLKKYPTKEKEKLYLSLCPMLYDCFPGDSSNFKHSSTCFDSLDNIISGFDSSIMMNGDSEIVGFSSFYLEKDVQKESDRAALMIYNVCVHPKHRNKGLGVKLMNDSTDHWIKHHKRTGKKTLLALDVDFKSLTSPSAFAMYAKLGYLRGWQPCATVGDVDWRPLYHGINNDSNQLLSPSPTPYGPPLHMALSLLLQDPKSYIDNVLYPSRDSKSQQMVRDHIRLPYRRTYPSNQIFDHFSMFKFYGDSISSLVQPLADSIQKKLAPNK